MELDERKLKILQAIIRTYLDTGEPVGSRTISKYTDLNLSSATIRNEMSDLEDMGYIFQPHTSAGRIPSDKGYRLYVDMLMADKEQELSDLKNVVLEKSDKVDKVLKQAARVLANNTNYATMISAPINHKNTLKFIQLSQVDPEQIVAVIVMTGNVIKNKIIEVDEELGNETMLKLNMLLNTSLNGMSIEEINLGLIARLKEQAGIHSKVISDVLDAVADIIHVEDDMEIYTEHQKKKLIVRPGITGYNQAYYRNSVEQNEKFENDVYYAENISFILDVKIFFKTIATVLTHDNVYNDASDLSEREMNRVQGMRNKNE